MIPTQRTGDMPVHQRQGQVLVGMARGLTNAQIGRELHLTEETVKTYAQRLIKHLRASNRAHAVAIGYETGLLRPGDVPTGRPDRPAPTRSH